MIVDTSAVVSILKAEPAASAIKDRLLEAGRNEAAALAAPSYVELISVAGRTQPRQDEVDALLRRYDIEIAPFDERLARAAASAYQRFGRGSGHPAKLNMGDVYSYALARVRNEPLLFVGDDLRHTDIVSALG